MGDEPEDDMQVVATGGFKPWHPRDGVDRTSGNGGEEGNHGARGFGHTGMKGGNETIGWSVGKSVKEWSAYTLGEMIKNEGALREEERDMKKEGLLCGSGR